MKAIETRLRDASCRRCVAQSRFGERGAMRLRLWVCVWLRALNLIDDDGMRKYLFQLLSDVLVMVGCCCCTMMNTLFQ